MIAWFENLNVLTSRQCKIEIIFLKRSFFWKSGARQCHSLYVLAAWVSQNMSVIPVVILYALCFFERHIHKPPESFFTIHHCPRPLSALPQPTAIFLYSQMLIKRCPFLEATHYPSKLKEVIRKAVLLHSDL